ncbi:MAG: hypothetical protein K2L56_04975, partial [Prevotella sp.]|nr:hypothetical protein [Prevotella sp.]
DMGDSYRKLAADGNAERAETPMELLRFGNNVRITLMYSLTSTACSTIRKKSGKSSFLRRQEHHRYQRFLIEGARKMKEKTRTP